MQFQIRINGKQRTVDVDERTPLLWVLRDRLGLTGTKAGCGAGYCGACTVDIGGNAARACVIPIGAVADNEVTTIEGIRDEGRFTALQQAWIDQQVPQCGYCQPGFIMAARSHLNNNPSITTEQLESSLNNICRCGTYPAIRRALAQYTKKLTERAA